MQKGMVFGNYDQVLTLEMTVALTIKRLFVVPHVIHRPCLSHCLCPSLSLQLMDHSWSLQPFEEGVWSTGYFLSSWSVSIYEMAGLRHRKGWWETTAQGHSSPALYVQWKFPKGHLLSLSVTRWVGVLCFWSHAFHFDRSLLILVRCQRVIGIYQWVEVLRKPLYRPMRISPLGPSEHIVLQLGL